MLRKELRVRDGKGGFLPYFGLEYFGYSIQKIKEWRSEEDDAGRPSSLKDFYGSHGLSVDCRSTGVQERGYSKPTEAELEYAKEQGLEELPVYHICPTCGGTGKVDAQIGRRTWESSH